MREKISSFSFYPQNIRSVSWYFYMLLAGIYMGIFLLLLHALLVYWWKCVISYRKHLGFLKITLYTTTNNFILWINKQFYSLNKTIFSQTDLARWKVERGFDSCFVVHELKSNSSMTSMNTAVYLSWHRSWISFHDDTIVKISENK